MHILAIALGGCVRGEPRYGITEDTGGHITYVLGAMRALSQRDDVSRAEIVTRLFDDAELGGVHGESDERLSAKLSITRIDSGNRSYLSKEALAADLANFTRALIAQLRSRDRLPDIIHAHFADAAEVARAVRGALGIPFIYTAHSLAIDKREADGGACLELENRISQENRAIGSADAIVGSSRDECERQLLQYPAADETRIHRIRPGIEQVSASPEDIVEAEKLIAPFLRNSCKAIILAIARPVRKKNLVALVEAYARNARLQERANLVILPGLRRSIDRGEAEQVAVLRELVDTIDRHDLHGKVAYPRQHVPSQVRGLYALARKTGGVFVNPALIEPFGLTILEAAAHGLPVVATCRGGPKDIVGEIEHGILVEPTDHAAVGDAIQGLLSNPQAWQAASRNAQKNIVGLTWGAYASSLRKVAGSIVRPAAALRRARPPRTLLVCDIDNTLTGCRSSAARLSRYLAEHEDIAFAVATGRSLVEARRLVRDWDLPEPMAWITSVGTEIHWSHGKKLEADHAYANRIANGWNGDVVSDALQSIAFLTPQGTVDQRRFKASYFLDDPTKLPVVRKTISAIDIKGRVVFSHDRLLDILPARAGKAGALSHLAETLGLPMDRIIAAGDSGNDLDMLKECPNAIVVANCEPELRKLSTRGQAYLARRNHAAGVLEGLAVYLDQMDTSPMEQAA